MGRMTCSDGPTTAHDRPRLGGTSSVLQLREKKSPGLSDPGDFLDQPADMFPQPTVGTGGKKSELIPISYNREESAQVDD